MTFECTTEGIEIQLLIEGYMSEENRDRINDWCTCWYCFRFGDQINFRNEHPEVLTHWEIDYLAGELTALLEQRTQGPVPICPCEPDFEFLLYPQKPEKTGHRIDDIHLEWRVNFWHKGLTHNYLTVVLFEDDIRKLRDFFRACQNEGRDVHES